MLWRPLGGAALLPSPAPRFALMRSPRLGSLLRAAPRGLASRPAHACLRLAPQRLVSASACGAALLSACRHGATCTPAALPAATRPLPPPSPPLTVSLRHPADWCRLLARCVWLGAILLLPLLLALPAYLAPSRCGAWFERVALRTLERGGVCWIKLGQWASTRNDVLPPSLCRTLSALHDKAPQHSVRHTERAIEAAFGAPSSAIFQSLSTTPVGSGCIAQVHEAVTMDGQKVAVKVLHPGVERTVAMDVFLMRRAARIAEWLPLRGVRWLSLSESIDQFAMFMASQLDLTVEAGNLERFRKNFGADDRSGSPPLIEFPRPLRAEGLVHPAVLVETFLQGERLSSLLRGGYSQDGGSTLRGGQMGLGPARDGELAQRGVEAFFMMVLRHNFVHADLHPGNILISAQDGQPLRIGFVDAGLATELSSRDQANFKRLFRALGMGDGRLAARLMLENATEQQCEDVDGFERGMERILQGVGLGGPGSFNLEALRIGDVLLELTNLVRQHRVKVEPNFTTVVTAIIILEGLELGDDAHKPRVAGRRLNPSLDLFDIALPMLL